jgi:hypothetical protein
MDLKATEEDMQQRAMFLKVTTPFLQTSFSYWKSRPILLLGATSENYGKKRSRAGGKICGGGKEKGFFRHLHLLEGSLID